MLLKNKHELPLGLPEARREWR